MCRAATPPSSPSELARRLRVLWRSATPETIGPALTEARALVAEAPRSVQAEVADLMQSLEQLERWLHDR